MLLQTTEVFQTYPGVARSRVCPCAHKGLLGEVDKQHLEAEESTLWIKYGTQVSYVKPFTSHS